MPRSGKTPADAVQRMSVLHIDRKGRITTGRLLFGRRQLTARVAHFVRRRMRMRADRTRRILVGQANCEADMQWLLEPLSGENVAYASVLPMGSAAGVHGGPATRVVALPEIEERP